MQTSVKAAIERLQKRKEKRPNDTFISSQDPRNPGIIGDEKEDR
jgi:hypothetical protein